MNTSIRTTIQVQFGGDSTGEEYIAAEVDGRPDGLNAGKTSFLPGETAYILVYKSSNVTINKVLSSAGSIVNASVGTVQKEEDVFFDDTNSATLSCPATRVVSISWHGNSLGDLALQTDEMTLKSNVKGVAVARVVYNTAPVAFGIASPAFVSNRVVNYSINVVIKASVS